jgi:ribosomal protein S18 acetylase RimI-like enzyme
MSSDKTVHVRPFVTEDREFVLSLAPRLLIGMSSWRDSESLLAAVQSWLTGSMEQHGMQTMVYIAENAQGERLGMSSVSHQRHFNGDRQAYIGELVVSEAAEGQGAGRALLAACEQWARAQGYRFLVLDTGTANLHARGFYQHLNFQEESVKLTKLL